MRTSRLGPTVVLFALSCAGGDPSPELAKAEIAPSLADDPARSGEPPSETSVEPPAEARRVAVVVFDDTDEPVRLPSLGWRPVPFPPEPDGLGYDPGSWPRVEHPDPERAAWLADALRETTVAFGRRAESSERHDLPQTVYERRCAATMARADLISLDCRATVQATRGTPWAVHEAFAFEVGGSALERFDVLEALTADAGLDRLVREACRRRERALEARAGGPASRPPFELDPREKCEAVPEAAEWAIAEDGLRAVHLCNPRTEVRSCASTVPYRALDGKILAGSPLGRALAALDAASVERVPVPTGSAPPGERVHGFAVTGERALGLLLQRWRELPEPSRDRLLVVPRGRRHAQLAHPDERRARSVASSFGHDVERIAWRHAVRPFLGRTRTPVNIRSGSRVLMIAPEGTFVTGVLGRLRGRDSSVGQRSTLAYVSVSPRLTTWAAGNLVEEHEGCVPSPERFLDALPDDRRPLASRTLVTARMETIRSGRRRPVAAFFAATAPQNRRRRGRFRAALYELGDDCAVGRRLARVDEDGILYAAFTTTTRPHGGRPLLVLGGRLDRREVRWTIRELGEEEVLYRTERRTGEDAVVGLGEGDAYRPFAIRATGGFDDEGELRLRWTGDALEEAPAP